MTLLYGWVKDLNNCRVEGGFSFSKRFLVSYDPEEGILEISDNKEYISEFFGSNIQDITVLVGENGAGKTILCRKIYSILMGEGGYGGSYVMVFWDGGGMHIYLRNDYTAGIRIDGELCPCERGIMLSPGGYKVTIYGVPDGVDLPMVPLSITNAFLMSDLEKNYDAEKDRRHYRSPAYLMENAREWAKSSHGSAWGGYLHRNSYNYASERTKNPLLEYQIYQNKLMVEGFFATKDIELMKKFSFYETFTMGVRSFGGNQEQNDQCSQLDKELGELEKERGGILDHCYFTLLKEAYLYCGVDRTEKNGEKFRPNDIGWFIIDRIKEWRQFSPSHSIIEDSFNQKLLTRVNAQVNENIKNNPDIRSQSADQWGWYQQLKSVFGQLQAWQSDTQKKRLFGYSIGTYAFDSPEGEELLEFYRERLREDEPFWKRTIGFNMQPGSTGEIAMVNLFGYMIDLIYSWKNKPGKDIFLIIDEIDVNLHPRWQQEIVSCIIDFLGQQFGEYRFQLLITSHSPICLSDIPSERILKMRKDEEGNTIQVSPCGEPTFGANIYDLFYDGFFMEEGTVGKFAQKKIDKAIGQLTQNHVGRETPYIVKSIGESMVREQMEELLSRVWRSQ